MDSIVNPEFTISPSFMTDGYARGPQVEVEWFLFCEESTVRRPIFLNPLTNHLVNH